MTCFTLPPSGNAVPMGFLLEAGCGEFLPAFASHCGVPANRILFTSSGASALYIALRGLIALHDRRSKTREKTVAPNRRGVAVPAWCCPSVPQTILQAGLVPIPVDLDPGTLGYDTSALREVRDDLLAVILVHFFGLPQPMPQGEWTGVAFLRDCAQDFDHRPGPDDALPAFFSFGRGKALNAGHGGALCFPATATAEADEHLEACRSALAELPPGSGHPLPKALAINLLSAPRIFWALRRMPFLGIGSTVWKAPLAMTRISPHFFSLGASCLEAYLQRKDFYRRLVNRYQELAHACDGDWLSAPEPNPSENRTGRVGLPLRFPILVRDQTLRSALLKRMNDRFGGVTRMYPDLLSRLPGAPEGFAAGKSFPGAERIRGEILTLPVTAELIGRETRFFDGLQDILADHGALRKRLVQTTVRKESAKAAPPVPAPDWTPVRPAADLGL